MRNCILLLILLSYVNQINNLDIFRTYQQNDTIKLANKIDKVKITCLFFGEFHNESFEIIISNNKLKFKDQNGEKLIENTIEHQRLINYVNRFYIQKSEKIIYLKKAESAPIADYPYIYIQAFIGKNKVLIYRHTLYSNLDLNPNFIKFYTLLNGLIVK